MRLSVLFLALLFTCVSATPAIAQKAGDLPTPAQLLAAASDATQVGGYVQNINPKKVPVPVDGYFTARYESEVIDELAARTLVIASGGNTIAVTIVDSCGIKRPAIDAAKQRASNATGIPVEHLFVAATHTHTAPAAFGGLGTDPDPDYREQLVEQIAESIIKASERLRPCEVGWASRDAERFAYCRRWRMKPGTAETQPFTGHADDVAMMNPGHSNPNKIEPVGPVDPEVAVFAFRDPESHAPLGLLANFCTHYAGSEKMSADYFGVVCREIYGDLPAATDSQEDFVALMSNGTSGDTNCIDFSQPQPVKFDRFDVAAEVSEKIAGAWGDITNWQTGLPLKAVATDLELAVRMPTADEAAAARNAVASWIDDRPPKNKAEVYARETITLFEGPPTDTVRLQSFALGGFACCSIPCEVYAVTGLRLKEKSPFPRMMTIGWANGYSGYLPPEEQYALGGYTTWRCTSSYLEPQAEEKIVRELLSQLAELKTE